MRLNKIYSVFQVESDNLLFNVNKFATKCFSFIMLHFESII